MSNRFSSTDSVKILFTYGKTKLYVFYVFFLLFPERTFKLVLTSKLAIKNQNCNANHISSSCIPLRLHRCVLSSKSDKTFSCHKEKKEEKRYSVGTLGHAPTMLIIYRNIRKNRENSTFFLADRPLELC